MSIIPQWRLLRQIGFEGFEENGSIKTSTMPLQDWNKIKL